MAAAVEGLRLDPDRAPDAASGGERRRAALARILAEAPDLMLLDEPTNHLDIAAIGWLEAHLADTRAAFVAVSHDRAFLRHLTDRLLWVDRGEVRRLDRGFAAFEAWRDKTYAEEDAARHKLDRLLAAEGRWAVEGISARRRRNQGRLRRLEELRAERRAEAARPGAARMGFDAAAPLRPAGGGGRAHRQGPRRPDASSATSRSASGAASGWRCVGPNGAGKTTLVNLLTGRLAPDAGTVRLGANLAPAVFDQDRAALDPEATLWETLTGDPGSGVPGRSDQVMVRGRPRHVVGYLKDFLFAEAQARGPVAALSGGEKARLLLAKLLAKPSNLLVLDEPTNDLDVETLDLLQELIADYDGTVLLVSHDRDFIDRVATTTVALEGDGRATVYAGGWSDYRSQRGAAPAPAAAGAPRPAAPPAPRPARRRAARASASPRRTGSRRCPARSTGSAPRSPGWRRCSTTPASTPATRRASPRPAPRSPPARRARRRRGRVAAARGAARGPGRGNAGHLIGASPPPARMVADSTNPSSYLQPSVARHL